MSNDGILSFSNHISTQTVTAGAAGVDVAIPERKKIIIAVDRLVYYKFSTDGTNAADTDAMLAAAGNYTFRTLHWTKLSFFAPAGTNAIVSVSEAAN